MIEPLIIKYNIKKYKPTKIISIIKTFFDIFENGYFAVKKVIFYPKISI